MKDLKQELEEMKINNEKINKIKNDFLDKIKEITDEKILNEIKIMFLGKKGLITMLYKEMGSLKDDEKKQFGADLNNLKNSINAYLEQMLNYLKKQAISKKLEEETIDISLPSTKIKTGCPNILEKMIEQFEELFMSMGYDVVEGPEVEQDLYNFELLNLPKGHPARDAQDTFYIKDDTLLLRSQTSPVQIRTMLANKEKTPIRIICPGKTYRRDDDDATHSHQFTQVEGLLIDENISLADLKGTFDEAIKNIFGERETRFRPSFYPFTEPSVELDISCFNCNSKGCNICKGTGYITVGGAGMVHPNVLKNCGYDPDKVTGFAFGFGLERLAMLKYGINDIRTFYLNDLRNNDTFNRLDVEE